MAVAVAGASTLAEQSTGTTVTITVPTGAVPGDLLLTCVHHSTAASPSTPAGWSAVPSGSQFTNATGMMVAYRWASSEPASYTFPVASGRTAVFMMRLSGVDPTVPFDVETVNVTSGITTSITLPSQTTVTAGTYLVGFGGANASASATLIPPSEQSQLQVTASPGRRTMSAAEPRASVGATGTRTWTLNPASPKLQMLGVQVALRPAGGAPAAALTSRVVGVDGWVKTKTVGATSVRLKVGTDQSVTTGVTYTSAVTPDGDGRATHHATGLTAGTYYYRVALTDTVESLDTAGTVGRLVISPTTAANFTVSMASCCDATDSAAMAAVAARADDLFLHRGDLWYADASGTSVGNFRVKMEARVLAPNHANVFATTPTMYAASDHDSAMNNNGNGTTAPTALANFNTVYREQFATPALPTGGTYYAHQHGRVLFVNLDSRSYAAAPSDTDNSSKSLLGAVQKQWVKDQIANTPAAVVVLCGDTPWVGAASAGDDGWFGYTNERAELAAHIVATGKPVCYVAGDMHGLAVGDGTNSAGGIPSFQAGPLRQTSSVKGGPWTVGPYPASAGSVVEQYGRLVVTDDGSAIGFAFTGYSADNTPRVTWSTTLAVSPSAGSATGTFTWQGVASGRKVSKGSGNGSTVWVGSATGNAPAAVVTSSLLAEYGFTEIDGAATVADATGNGHTGTVVGSGVTFVAGPPAVPGSRAVRFSDVGQAVRIDRAGLEPVGGVTTMFWYFMPATGSNTNRAGDNGPLVKQRDLDSTRHGFYFPPASDGGSVIVRWDNNLQLPSADYVRGTWRHFCVVDGPNGWAIFEDGVQVRSGPRSGLSNTNAWEDYPWSIGRSAAFLSDSNVGMMVAAPRIFAGVLTESEVATWRTTPVAGGAPPPPPSGSGSGAVGWVGSGSGRTVRRGAGSGTVKWSGAATGRAVRKGTATGQWISTGTATGTAPVVPTRSGSASGTSTWSGAATGARSSAGAAAGALRWAGSATGRTVRDGSGSGQWTSTGAAGGSAPTVGAKSGSAAGATAWSGLASGSSRRAGLASGSWSAVGAASGSTRRSGAATGGWVFAGTADGFHPVVGGKSGSTSGAVAWSGAAAGVRHSQGTTAGGWVFVGAAVGSKLTAGVAAGGWVFTGAAGGFQPVVVRSGTASGTVAWSGVAGGNSTRAGSVAGQWVTVGLAAGSRPVLGVPSGVATGAVVWVGYALAATSDRDITVRLGMAPRLHRLGMAPSRWSVESL